MKSHQAGASLHNQKEYLSAYTPFITFTIVGYCRDLEPDWNSFSLKKQVLTSTFLFTHTLQNCFELFWLKST